MATDTTAPAEDDLVTEEMIEKAARVLRLERAAYARFYGDTDVDWASSKAQVLAILRAVAPLIAARDRALLDEAAAALRDGEELLNNTRVAVVLSDDRATFEAASAWVDRARAVLAKLEGR